MMTFYLRKPGWYRNRKGARWVLAKGLNNYFFKCSEMYSPFTNSCTCPFSAPSSIPTSNYLKSFF